MLFEEGKGLSTQEQQYDHTAVINAARTEVDKWRALPNPSDWRVTPETARLLQYWRHHNFSSIRPFFCQVEAVETAIWLTEVAPQLGKADADFDVLIACAFNYDAHSSDFGKLGRIPVLKARMNADLHMADDLKSTGKGNLFVIFGEPDIEILDAEGGQMRVKVNGVDVFKPNTGTVESSNTDEIACWFIDTDYNEESFFVRQAYFLGQNDPYKSLKTTLKAEINPEAWATLNSDTSRPFDKPKSGRIAVKVINHLGDEVMKVFKVS